MLARSGSYAVKSRLIDDDKQVWLDFEWGKLHLAVAHVWQLIIRIQTRQGVVIKEYRRYIANVLHVRGASQRDHRKVLIREG